MNAPPSPATRRHPWVMLLGLLLLAPTLAQAKNIALMISVADYASGAIPKLPGAAADLTAVRERLVSRWQFADKDIRALQDAEATRPKILAELDALHTRSQPGDMVLVYFAGHGTSAKDGGNAWDLPYDTGAWIPYEMQLSDPKTMRETLIIGRRDLLPRLKKLDESGRTVVVISDSCFSGQLVRSSHLEGAPRRFVPLPALASTTLANKTGSGADAGTGTPDPGPATRNTAGASKAPTAKSAEAPPPYPYGRVVLLSATSDHEAAVDISGEYLKMAPTIDGKPHGAFTDALLRLMDGTLTSKRGLNYAEVRQTLSRFMASRGYGHEPQLLPGVNEDRANVAGEVFLRDANVSTPPGKPPLTTDKVAENSRESGRVKVRLASDSGSLRTRIAATEGVQVVEGDADLVVSETAGHATLSSAANDPVLVTSASDTDLLRRIASQVWLEQHLPVRSENLSLRAETSPTSRGGTFRQCESFSIHVRPDRPSFVAVLNLDPKGKLSLLYPNRASELAPSEGSAPLVLPDESAGGRIKVVPPFGTDLVTVLAFAERPVFLETLMGNDSFLPDSKRGKALAQGLANYKGGIATQRLPIRTFPNPEQNGPCPLG